MLTAAVRDLHRSHPGEFLTDVRTPFPDLWLFNTYITSLDEADPDVRIVDCHYPSSTAATRRRATSSMRFRRT
jgi:hypothetical protein